MVKKNLGDDLAQAMDNVLNDEEYQKIFTRPKLASKTIVKEDKPLDSVQAAFDALLEVSAELDELGLAKSSVEALKAAYSIASEAGLIKENKESRKELWLVPDREKELFLFDDEESGEDEELEKLLKEFGDRNEVMDKPDNHDESEGNPESR